MQLDRFLKRNSLLSQKTIRQLIIQGRVTVDGAITKDVQRTVSPFSHIQLDDTVLQSKTPYYVMLNKPAGTVSATAHPCHRTVLDCVKADFASQLHLAGRLDFNTTGLVLLTNDGRWSRKITQPEEKIAKTYWVATEDEITSDYKDRFADPMHLAYEDIHLLPAELEILSSHTARISIFEGRYHQIKRMFGFFNNKVVALHRESMGSIKLDSQLAPGAHRMLTEKEIVSAGK